MDFVMDLCHRIMVMVEGTVMAMARPPRFAPTGRCSTPIWETDMAQRHAIQFDDVVAGYGEFMILNDLSFEVARGKITLLLGPNGAGKSTVLKTLFGLLSLRQGRVTLDGQTSPAPSARECC